MKVDIINQMFGTNVFANRLKEHLSKAYKGSRLRALVAFVKRSGLALLEPELTGFLENQGSAKWIVGIDCGCTSPDALDHLLGLSKMYPHQVEAKVFSAGSRWHVFHPKLYLLDSKRNLMAWLGSANMTAGGMFLNCECVTELAVDRKLDAREAHLLDDVWNSYESSSPFLHDLTPQVISKVAEQHGPEQPSEAWSPPKHPFGSASVSGLPKLPRPPRLTTSLKQSSQSVLKAKGNTLIMEILQETRDTQVQIPVDALEDYFGIRQGEKARIALRHKRGKQVKSAKFRNVIYPTSHVRVEMETISGLKRPLIAVFHRDPAKDDTYEYELLENGTKRYEKMRKTLERKGKRTSRISRWYLIR